VNNWKVVLGKHVVSNNEAGARRLEGVVPKPPGWGDPMARESARRCDRGGGGTSGVLKRGERAGGHRGAGKKGGEPTKKEGARPGTADPRGGGVAAPPSPGR